MDTSEITFTKMSGTGNDFILLNNSTADLALDWPALARRYCHRRLGIGADGVIVLAPSQDADFTMRIFNADGSEAEMCGNGARCAAAFAVDQGLAASTMRFSTLAGLIEARVQPGVVSLKMTNPHSLEGKIHIAIDDKDYVLYCLDTGVPHAILFTEDVDSMQVDTLGRAIRYHRMFAPGGTNADFVQVIDRDHIKVRTYERGVEAETLACGTGATASAILSHAYKGVRDKPVHVRMPGGDLMIDFSLENGQYKNVWLIGGVETVFRGVIPCTHGT